MVNRRTESNRNDPAATIHEYEHTNPKPEAPSRKPIRTCIACKRKAHPHEFFRISNHPEMGPILVESGAAPGRSAYLCKTAECVEAGMGKGRLARSLKAGIPAERTEAIQKELICKLQK